PSGIEERQGATTPKAPRATDWLPACHQAFRCEEARIRAIHTPPPSRSHSKYFRDLMAAKSKTRYYQICIKRQYGLFSLRPNQTQQPRIDSESFLKLKTRRRFKFKELREKFRLTYTEKRVVVFVLAAFMLGLVTKYYRYTHPSPAPSQSNLGKSRPSLPA